MTLSGKKTIAAGLAVLGVAAAFLLARTQPWQPPAASPSPGMGATAALQGPAQAGIGLACRAERVSDADGLDANDRADRMNRILERMRKKHYDAKPVLQELMKRLKESPDGKLSREEVRRILPRDMAQDYEEFLAVIQSESGGGRL